MFLLGVKVFNFEAQSHLLKHKKPCKISFKLRVEGTRQRVLNCFLITIDMFCRMPKAHKLNLILRANIRPMKRFISFICSFFLAVISIQAQSVEDDIIGNWQDKSHKNKQVQIYSQSKKYFGKPIDNSSKLIFKELTWNPTKQVYQGFIISPDSNDTFPIEIKMIGKNAFQFTVRSFIFKTTFQFVRI